jgi:hypothetical protein
MPSKRRKSKPSVRINVHAIRRKESDFHRLVIALIELAEEEIRKEDALSSAGRYNNPVAYIISADEIKKTLPGYDPGHSEEFHSTSAKLADKAYAQALKDYPDQTVILMCGGSASGKSEYVSVYLQDKPVIILDGTLPSFEGAKIKIRKALKAGKIVEVHCVLPESLLIAFIAFLNRDRKFPVEHFYRTHSSARKTVLEVAKVFPDVTVKLIVSHGAESSIMSFTEKQFQARGALIEFLETQQYTEEEIRNKVIHHDQ